MVGKPLVLPVLGCFQDGGRWPARHFLWPHLPPAAINWLTTRPFSAILETRAMMIVLLSSWMWYNFFN